MGWSGNSVSPRTKWMSSGSHPEAAAFTIGIRLVAEIHSTTYILCSSFPLLLWLSPTIPLGIFAITPFTGSGTEHQRSLFALNPNPHRKWQSRRNSEASRGSGQARVCCQTLDSMDSSSMTCSHRVNGSQACFTERGYAKCSAWG